MYYFSFALVRMHLFYSQIASIVLIVMNVVVAVSKVLNFPPPIESKPGPGERGGQCALCKQSDVVI